MDGAFGTAFAIGASINRAVALSLVGLGFILALRANLTNVGGEGQIAVGGIAATALAPVAADRRPAARRLPWSCRCWAARWRARSGAASPAFMKVRFGTNEVISTLLLGFVALLHGLLVRAVDGAAAPAADHLGDAAGIAGDPRRDQAAAA